MRLLVSCIPYDGGKSGISVYVREVVRELYMQGHELTLLCEDGLVVEWFSGDVVGRLSGESQNHQNHQTTKLPNYQTILAPGWTRRPALSMLWHLFVLPLDA